MTMGFGADGAADRLVSQRDMEGFRTFGKGRLGASNRRDFVKYIVQKRWRRHLK